MKHSDSPTILLGIPFLRSFPQNLSSIDSSPGSTSIASGRSTGEESLSISPGVPVPRNQDPPPEDPDTKRVGVFFPLRVRHSLRNDHSKCGSAMTPALQTPECGDQEPLDALKLRRPRSLVLPSPIAKPHRKDSNRYPLRLLPTRETKRNDRSRVVTIPILAPRPPSRCLLWLRLWDSPLQGNEVFLSSDSSARPSASPHLPRTALRAFASQ